MAKPYSEELRRAIIMAIGNGCTLERVAVDFEVSLSSVKRFHRRWRETGSVRPRNFGGHKPYALKPHEELIKEVVLDRPDITVRQMQVILLKQGITASRPAIARFLDHLYPEAAADRKAWREQAEQVTAPGPRLG